MAKWIAVGAAGLMAVAVSGCSASPAVQVVPVKCPTKPPVILLMTDLAPGRLAPADATQGVMCAYAGVNDKAPEGSLTRSVPVADAAALAALLNEATPTPPGAVYHCPMDDGGIDAVVLARSSGAPVIVEVHRTGCRFATSTLAKTSFILSAAALGALHVLDPTVR